MKSSIVAMLLVMVIPVAALAKEPTNEELYKMIKAMERKFDAAIKETSRALNEADKARKEAAEAKAELVKAQEDLARIKAAKPSETTLAEIAAPPFVRTAETKPGLGTSLEAVFLRPTRGDLEYVIVDRVGNGNPQGSFDRIEPDYQLGGRLGLNYDFGSGTTVGVQLMGINTIDSKSAAAPSGGRLWGTWLHPNAIIDDDDVTFANGRYSFEHYTVDLGATQKLDIGKRFGLDISAGMRYASMRQNLSIYYLQNIGPGLDRSANITETNNFSGWGPRIGMNFEWRIGYGFSVFSSLAGSLLMADVDMSLTEVDKNVGGTITTRANIREDVHSRVVPVIETKIGVGYTHQLKNGWTIGANAGYEWQNWFNAVTSRRFSDDVDPQLASTDTTDVGLDGFFLRGFINF